MEEYLKSKNQNISHRCDHGDVSYHFVIFSWDEIWQQELRNQYFER